MLVAFGPEARDTIKLTLYRLFFQRNFIDFLIAYCNSDVFVSRYRKVTFPLKYFNTANCCDFVWGKDKWHSSRLQLSKPYIIDQPSEWRLATLSRDGTGQDFLDPTDKFQNLRRLTGRSISFWPARSTSFLQKVFVHCSVHLIKNFQKKGAHRWVVKIYDSEWRSQKKRKKIFAFFTKIAQF